MRPRELAEPELSQLKRGLALAVRNRGWSFRHVSRLLKRYPEYMGRTLNGRAELKVSQTFRLLELLGLEPYLFFETYYPLGGSAVLATEQLKQAVAAPERLLMNRFAADGLSQVGSGVDAQAWAARVGFLLRQKLRQAGRSQAELAVTLAMTPSAFGQRLRGGSRVLWWQVFAVLRLLKIDAGRFFYELMFPDRSLGATLAIGEILNAWERGQQEMAAEVARREKAHDMVPHSSADSSAAEPTRDS
jgi:hypothetical protein